MPVEAHRRAHEARTGHQGVAMGLRFGHNTRSAPGSAFQLDLRERFLQLHLELVNLARGFVIQRPKVGM